MKYKLLYFWGICCFFLSACEKDDIDTYHADNYIQFAKYLKDSSIVTFAYYPGKTDIEVPVIVEMSSFASVEDEKEYIILVDTALSTAVEGVHFDLPRKMFFNKNAIVDTMYVTFHLQNDMEQKAYRLVLRVAGNENFRVGQWERSINVFWIHNQLSRPAWWDSSVEKNYLGKYSVEKYQLLIREAEVSDFSSLSDSEKRAAALVLKYYLEREKHEGRPVWDTANNEEMRVTIKGN